MSKMLKSLACAVALSGMAAFSQQVVITSSPNPASGSTLVTFTITGDCPNDTQHAYNYGYQWSYARHGTNVWEQFGQSGSRAPQNKITWGHYNLVPGVYDIKAQVAAAFPVCPGFSVQYTQTLTQ